MPIYTVIGQIEVPEGRSHAENLAEIADKLTAGMNQGGFPKHAFELSIASPAQREAFQNKVGEVPAADPFKAGDNVELKSTDILFNKVDSPRITGVIVNCRGWYKSKFVKGGFFYYDIELDLSSCRYISRADYELIKLE